MCRLRYKLFVLFVFLSDYRVLLMDGIFPMSLFSPKKLVFAHSDSLCYLPPLITFTHFCSLTNLSLLTYFIIRILSIPQGWAQNPITSSHYPPSSSQGSLCSLSDYREYLFYLSSVCPILGIVSCPVYSASATLYTLAL